MVPTVVIQIAPPDVGDARMTDILVEACSRVVSDGDCALESPDGGAPQARVGVTFVTDTEVRIEVVVSASEARYERVLQFREEDEVVERFRAVGLIAGTLASGLDVAEPPVDAPPPSDAPLPEPPRASEPDAEEATPPPPPDPAPPRAPPPEPPSPTPPEPVLFAGIVANAGPGFERGPWRLGGALDGGLYLGPALIAASLGGARTVGAVDGVSGLWWFVALGAGVRLELADWLSGTVRVDGLVQRLDTSAVDATTGTEDSGGRFVPGGRIVVDAAFWVVPAFALTLGGETRLLASATDVRTRGAVTASEPQLRASLWAGVRVRF